MNHNCVSTIISIAGAILHENLIFHDVMLLIIMGILFTKFQGNTNLEQNNNLYKHAHKYTKLNK